MIEDLSRYSAERKSFVQKWYETNRDHTGVDEAIAIMAIASGCPCIVVAYWIAEIEGMTEGLKKNIDIITKFYGYTEIKHE